MAYIGKSPSSGIRNRFIYTATAGQTTFSGADDENRTLSYTDGHFTDVYLNGVKLDKSDYTATSGTSVVLDEGAAVDDILEVVAFDTFSVFSGEFSADVTVGGTLTASGNVDVTGDLTASADVDVTGDLTVDTDTLYVDSANNRVGVGTSSPSKTLHVYHATTNKPALIESGDAFSLLEFKDSSTTNIPAIGADGNNIIIQTGSLGSERMRIDSSGNVRMGSSLAQADPRNYTGNNQQGIQFNYASLSTNEMASTYGLILNCTNGGTANATAIGFRRRGTTCGSISVTGTTTAYNTSSDYRLKENIETLSGAITRVKALQPKRFSWVSDDLDSANIDGFIAHEAQSVVPEAVTGVQDETETLTNVVLSMQQIDR